VAPLRLAVKYLLHSGTTTLFAERYRDLSASRKLFKVLQSGIYLLSVLVGIPAAVWALIGGAGRASNRAGLVPCIFVLFFLLAYPLLMRRVEYRYAIPAHPFALLLGCSVVVRRKP
jgi:membrane protein YdbS with pleckstrin-like domain